MIELTPAEEQKAKQLRLLLVSDGRDKQIPDRIVHMLMGKFKAPFSEVEKAIRLVLVLPSKQSPLSILKTRAFDNGRCRLVFPEEQKGASSFSGIGHDTFYVLNYERAQEWFQQMASEDARGMLARISDRLRQLEQFDAADDPLSYSSGKVLLVWWWEFCQNQERQTFHRAYACGEIHTPESFRARSQKKQRAGAL